MSEILVLQGAAKGTGSTPLAGARRARCVGQADIKRAPGSPQGIPAGAWRTGIMPRVIVECEGLAEVVNAITGQLVAQTLALFILTSEGVIKRTCKYATAIAVGESRFPPAEGSENVPRNEITFAIHAGSGIEQPGEAVVDAAFSGTVPSEDGEPLIQLLSAARGAAGGTVIGGFLSARLRCNFSVTLGRRNQYGLPVGAWVTNVAPTVTVEIEERSAWRNALVEAGIDETLLLTYQAGAANRVLRAKWARLVDPGEEPHKAPEEQGPPGRVTLSWDLVRGTGVQSAAQMLTVT